MVKRRWLSLHGGVWVERPGYRNMIAQCVSDTLSDEELDANAKSIAHKLNSHDELLAALEEVLALEGEAREPCLVDIIPDHCKESCPQCRARAAIAKAKGG